MKNKKIFIIAIIIIAVLLILGVFARNIFSDFTADNAKSRELFSKNIIKPDRIVYRNSNGEYFEFISDEKYDKLINLISNSLANFSTDGKIISDEEIDNIHSKSFIEFDYKTASKNYIIPLDNIEGKNIIKLSNAGGNVCSEKIHNYKRIKELVEDLSKDSKKYSLDSKQYISRNNIEFMQYDKLRNFKEVSYKIYQVKITNIKEYNKFKDICNLAFEEKIDDSTFDDNVVILTLSLVPKINVKVNIGNIKYTYEKIEGANFQYTAHVLIVSKIVNTDCIYNTDLSEISNKVESENAAIEYDKKVENIDKNIFVTDFEEFYNEYNNTESGAVEMSKAKEIAEKGFKEAERIVGAYDESTEDVKMEEVYPNNFFTRKERESDKTEKTKVSAYVFTRYDEMGNGVQIYIDLKLGKIIGGGAFGD